MKKGNLIIGISVAIILLILYQFSRRSGYADRWRGPLIKSLPFDDGEINGCKGCRWGFQDGSGNKSQVVSCANCGNGKPSSVFAPYCRSRESLHSDGKVLAC